MKRNYWIALAASLAAALFAGCSSQPAQHAAENGITHQFDVKGRLKSVAPDARSAVIEHETIPGYMPAMTMPFYVKDPAELKNLERGNALAFRFVVTESDSWIEDVRKLADDAIAQSPSGERARATGVSSRIPALEPGDVAPNFRLTNQAGERFQLGDFLGKEVVLTFIFTRCPVPNFCPLMSENFRALDAMLVEGGKSDAVRLLSVTIDPEYDTPEMLRVYAARYKADTERWIFATGSPEEIDELTARFSVYVEPEQGTITHGLATAHITSDGRLGRVWRGNGWTAEEVYQSIQSARQPGAEHQISANQPEIDHNQNN